jgi:hypothetical protein
MSLKQLIAVGLLIVVGCWLSIWLLRSRAPDLWGYGLGVNDGTQTSPVYYVEVRGVGSTPTIARVVRFEDPTTAPMNSLDVSNAVLEEFDSRLRNVDRWNNRFTLIAGRDVDEKVYVTIDASAAKKLFSKPGPIWDYSACSNLWDEHIAPQLPDK